MTKKRPPHVSMYRDRHRVVRWRFRKRGLPQLQTKLAFGSDEWWSWYFAAMTGEKRQVGAERTSSGTISALAVDYYESSDFKLLAETTKKTYRGEIERLRVKHGDKPVARLQTEHIRRMMDAKAETPAAANNVLRVLRILMGFAVERKWRTDDPTSGVKRLRYKSDGFHTWTEDEIGQFAAFWALGTRERLALDLLLYTGQRSGDVRAMGRQHVTDNVVTVRQEKTGATVQIGLHEALQASVAAYHSGQLTFLVTQFGTPYTAKGFGNWFSDAARKAGLPVGCSAHGLRKAACRRLAEVGCSAHEIMAITGHKTLKEVERYTRAVSQLRLARSAMDKLRGTEPEQNLSNRTVRLDNSGGK